MTAAYPHPWPEGARCGVSLTFDDGTPNHLHEAVPRLTDRGLAGTFYLPMRGEDWQEKMSPWAAVAPDGHELGNHSVHHYCSENFRNERKPYGLESMTLEDMAAELDEAERRMDLLYGPAEARSYAYPCYMTHVGRGRTRQSFVPLVAERFVAGRGGGEAGFHNHPYHSDLACLAGLTCQGMSGAEMVGLVERAARQGRWCILVFHGIGTGWLSTTAYDYEELLDHLASQRDRVWTAPVATVARHLTAARVAEGLPV